MGSHGRPLKNFGDRGVAGDGPPSLPQAALAHEYCQPDPVNDRGDRGIRLDVAGKWALLFGRMVFEAKRAPRRGRRPCLPVKR
jgi:hypothetical protein